MSTKPETTFYQAVHKYIPRGVYAVKMNNPYVGGIPDCWYSGIETDLWVEYKFIVLPKRDDTGIDIDLSKLQRNWINDRHAEGRNVWVIVGCKDGGVILKDHAWDNTEMTASFFKRLLLPRKMVAQMISDFVGTALK